MNGYKLNWRRQAPDHRDWLFRSTITGPHWVDLRSNAGCPQIYDQLQIGSCTANMAAGASREVMIKEGVFLIDLSRLDLYYKSRVLEGTPGSDSGATIRDAMKAGARGVVAEPVWPYGDGSTFATVPQAEATAPVFKLKSYLAVPNFDAIKQSLALGYPVCFGIDVYDSFLSNTAAATGMIPMPGPGESVQGGHALRAVGYRDSIQCVIFANSWGEGWGDKGYGYIPYDYLRSTMAADFWSPRLF